jgi:hypothetical protein
LNLCKTVTAELPAHGTPATTFAQTAMPNVSNHMMGRFVYCPKHCHNVLSLDQTAACRSINANESHLQLPHVSIPTSVIDQAYLPPCQSTSMHKSDLRLLPACQHHCP